MKNRMKKVSICICTFLLLFALNGCKKDKNLDAPVNAQPTALVQKITIVPTLPPTATPDPSPTEIPTAPTSAPDAVPIEVAEAPQSTPVEKPPTPTPTLKPAATPTPRPTVAPTSTPEPKSDLGKALLELPEGEYWYVAASYGSFDINDQYSFAGKTFNKAVVVSFEEGSPFPSGEVFMVISNPTKEFKTLQFDAWVETVNKPENGAGLFCVMPSGDMENMLQDLSQLPAGEIKSVKVDISAYDEIWIYTGLNPGCQAGFANVVVK
ncbi:MAG: hypothetical protein KBA53_06690 [Thermoclostridium sp.]|nr:hypothetical protein [Thermoclostridium sp.]